MSSRKSTRLSVNGKGHHGKDEMASIDMTADNSTPAAAGLEKAAEVDGAGAAAGPGAKVPAAPAHASTTAELTPQDIRAIALLVVLYFLQGIPVGLAFGTMPFLLKARLSYSDIGIFSLATYPYSLKLLWSPIVDSCFVYEWRVPILGFTLSLGRRKSWIVPIQAIVGVLFYLLSTNVDSLLLVETPNVYLITSLFFVLVLFAATQGEL